MADDSTSKWEDEVRKTFLKLKQNRDIKEITVDGVLIKIMPDVFSPAIFFESQWFACEVAKLATNKKLLEVGPGTGIIALFAALKGAEVAVVDVNERAIENTRLNFNNMGLQVDAYVGSLYDPLSHFDKFDIIFWNHPFNKSDRQETDVLLRSVFDYQYTDLKGYIAQASSHLLANGRLLLGTSCIANLEEIEDIAQQFGYKLELLSKIERESEIDDKNTDYRIYELHKS